MITNQLTTDGVDLAYRAAGPPSGEPVLMLHGYFGSHMTWRHQIDALSDEHRVVAPDWFRWGASGLADDAEYAREVDNRRRHRVDSPPNRRATDSHRARNSHEQTSRRDRRTLPAPRPGDVRLRLQPDDAAH